MRATLAVLVVLVATAHAQRILATRFGQLNGRYGSELASAGDVDRDGVADVLAYTRGDNNSPQIIYPRVDLLSGRDLSLLRSFQATAWELFGESFRAVPTSMPTGLRTS
jgi:hypothetical protein